MTEHARPNGVETLAVWLVLTAPALGGEDREQLLATARDGNRAAILSINSMECQYERQPWANTSPEQANKYFRLNPGKFWRSGETYRLLQPMGDGTTQDYVVRNGQGHFLRKGGPLPRPLLMFAPLGPVDGVGGGEMWQHLLFHHWGWVPPPGASFYSFYDILEHPYVLHKAERLPPPANDIHVDLSHGGGREEFWFDPKVNYLIRKSVMVPAGDKTLRLDHEVIEFAEPAPAVFVPVIVEDRCSVNGKLQAVVRTVLSDLKVNQPLSKDGLRMPGIAGMDCVDMNRDVKYKVDADGNAIGPESPVKVAHNVSIPSRPGGDFIPSGVSNFFPQPSKPHTPLWVWVLIVSITVLVAGLILTIVRRRRRAAQA